MPEFLKASRISRVYQTGIGGRLESRRREVSVVRGKGRWLQWDPETIRLPVGTTVDEAKQALVHLTLGHVRNNKARGAEILGISPIRVARASNVLG